MAVRLVFRLVLSRELGAVDHDGGANHAVTQRRRRLQALAFERVQTGQEPHSVAMVRAIHDADSLLSTASPRASAQLYVAGSGVARTVPRIVDLHSGELVEPDDPGRG
jgi:hypothetical protein